MVVIIIIIVLVTVLGAARVAGIILVAVGILLFVDDVVDTFVVDLVLVATTIVGVATWMVATLERVGMMDIQHLISTQWLPTRVVLG